MIAEELGRTPRFVQVAFASLDQSAIRGDFEVGLSGIEDTPARRAAVAASIPYYEFREVLTVREADRDRFRTRADLRGSSVRTVNSETPELSRFANPSIVRLRRSHDGTLFGILAHRSPDLISRDFDELAQRSIDRFGAAEHRSHIRLEQHDVRSLAIAIEILAPDASANVVLGLHFLTVGLILLTHKSSTPGP
jgi:polar amino acid transport system substrate-binding protein